METKNLISANKLCELYNIPTSFVDDLMDYELIEIVVRDEESFIEEDHIRHFEKLMRLHYDLNINYEGLDVILNLMKQIEEMRSELQYLRNRIL